MKEISNRIFELLKLRGKSQKELSDYTGIKPAAISQWKVDNTNPKAECIAKIAEFLEVSTDYLLGKTNNKPAGLQRFSEILLEKGLCEEDIEGLSKEKLSLVADMIKNLK